MITSIVVTFNPVKDCVLPAATGNYIHGLMLSVAQSADEAVAEALHADERAKPFTVSPIFGDFVPDRTGNNRLKKDGEYWFRITLLNKDLSLFFINALNSGKERMFSIAGNEMAVKEVMQDSSQHEWAGQSSHERIYDKYIVRQEMIGRKVQMRFLTPTTFRTDKANVVLPVPAIVFASIFEKWNKFSPVPVDRGMFFDWVGSSIAVSKHNIRTRMWDFDKYKYIGFAGDVEFTDLNKEETAFRALFNMLAEYSFWCGAGSKTTMGFGMAGKLR